MHLCSALVLCGGTRVLGVGCFLDLAISFNSWCFCGPGYTFEEIFGTTALRAYNQQYGNRSVVLSQPKTHWGVRLEM